MPRNHRKYKSTTWMEARAEAWFHEDYDMGMLRSTSKAPTWTHMRRVYEQAFMDGQEHPDIDVDQMEREWSHEA